MTKILQTLLLLLLLQTTCAQNGSFDTTFGTSGHKQFSLGDKNTRGNFLLLLPGDSFLVAGNSDIGGLIDRSSFITKFTSDGNPDNAFGDNGTISIANGPVGMSYISDAILQPDGKILITGQINGSPKMLRIDQYGTYDLSFGADGIATADTFGRAVIQPDGKIIVVGYFHDGYATSYSLSRYHTDGSPDLSFGNNGTRINNITPYRFDLSNAVKMQADKIVVAGTSYDSGDQQYAVISRFNADGTPDTTFGNTGTMITTMGNLPGYAVFYDLAPVDNKIIAVGTMQYVGGTGGFMGTKPVFAQFNTDGSLDTDFGTGGKVILNTIFNANDNFYSLRMQPDGKILGIGTSGHAFPNPQAHLNITRLHPDGNLDLTFGTNGTVLTDNFDAETNVARQIEILPDGKLLCLGITRQAIEEHFDVLLCRLNPDVLGTVEHQNGSRLAFYPNPTNGHLFIKGLQPNSRLRLYNVLGQSCVLQIPAIDPIETRIDLTQYPTGTYALIVESDWGSWVEKIVID